VSQLANAGYRPSDISYFALSHYHSDHTGNANAFAGATWITQKAERDFMFGDKPQGSFNPATYSALKGSKTRILDNQELDVFGDGTVRLIPTPGHTPGHQVLLVRLPKRGPVLLAGDLYHYPEERTKGNRADVRIQRRAIESVARQGGSAPQADESRALDRARHGHPREAAEGARIR
jgi:glyoxylase-like metal-dependent hydrolase (beta-lactamase superfamily II)